MISVFYYIWFQLQIKGYIFNGCLDCSGKYGIITNGLTIENSEGIKNEKVC